MAGIETGPDTTTERANEWADALAKNGRPGLAELLRALASDRDTLAEQLNVALADAVTLAHRLTSAEGERDALASDLFTLRNRAGCGPEQSGPDVWDQRDGAIMVRDFNEMHWKRAETERDAAVAARVAAEGEVARLSGVLADLIGAAEGMALAMNSGMADAAILRAEAALAATAQGGDGRG